MGWYEGPPHGGEVPAIFIFSRVNGIEIFIDEAGDFGKPDERCPYYIVTMVFHESSELLYEPIRDLELHLLQMGLVDHCIHSSPAIRGDGEYYGWDPGRRKKIISLFASFIRKSNLKWKCFFVEKRKDMTESDLVRALKESFDPFILSNFRRLSTYSSIIVAYDSGQKQLSRLITETFEQSFSNVTVTKVLPIQSRMFQVADFICTMKRLEFKVSKGGPGLSKSETFFFGSRAKFIKDWLKPFTRSEWQ